MTTFNTQEIAEEIAKNMVGNLNTPYPAWLTDIFVKEICAILDRHLEEMAVDAKRWQWWKRNINPEHFCAYMNYHPSDIVLYKMELIDAAIDKAMIAEAEKS